MFKPSRIRRYLGELRALVAEPSVSRQPTLTAMHHEVLKGLGFGNTDPRRNGELAALRRTLGSRTGEPAILLDVGANRGDYTAMLLAELGSGVEIHCFEPSPTSFVELERRLASEGPVHLHKIGISDIEGERELFSDRLGSEAATLYGRAGVAQGQVETVRLRRLDAVCVDLGITRVDFLKVDAEGHDLAVLAGCGDLLDGRRIAAIQFEHGGTAPDARVFLRDFFELLEPAYVIHRVLPDGLWPLDRYTEAVEVSLYANYIALPRRQTGSERDPA
jgi:FkbM family methyltransferase